MAPLAKPEALSEISRDIGQVFFASMVVSPFLVGSDELLIAAGLSLALAFWFISLALAKS